jgi:hypothetical protein
VGTKMAYVIIVFSGTIIVDPPRQNQNISEKH